MVEFVSYNGCYPNLCSGTLVLRIDGVEHMFLPYEDGFHMNSGGCVWFDDSLDEHVSQGSWTVDVPKKFEKYKDEITACVNENVPFGCCGGCV